MSVMTQLLGVLLIVLVGELHQPLLTLIKDASSRLTRPCSDLALPLLFSECTSKKSSRTSDYRIA